MNAQVVAAIIAASVSALTLIGTVAAQIIGFRSTRANTEEQIRATHENTADTLAQQREQLRQTLDKQRTRMLNERFATAADELGSDKPAIRLAGVYAMAGLADDWEESRQTCVDVLCAYLRMPYEPEPGEEAPEAERLVFRASREVRHTVIRVIAAHLKDDAAKSWQDLDFDFTGVVFDGGDFGGVRFSGVVDFGGARFSSGWINFGQAEFFSGAVSFRHAEFSGGMINFDHARFSGSWITFGGAQFCGGWVNFSYAKFSGAIVDFLGAKFSDGTVIFGEAEFSDGMINFDDARFSGGTVSFPGAEFSGGEVSFPGAEFSGGEVDFSGAKDWSVPPEFPWADTPPPGVKLPKKEDQSQA